MTSLLLAMALVSAPQGEATAWTGRHSKVLHSEVRLITDAKGWAKTWSLAREEEPTPKIDFQKSFVVARFGGRTTGVGGYRLAEIMRPGIFVGVNLVPLWFQTRVTKKGLEKLEPYGFFVIPKDHIRRVLVHEAVPGIKTDKELAFRGIHEGWLPKA